MLKNINKEQLWIVNYSMKNIDGNCYNYTTLCKQEAIEYFKEYIDKLIKFNRYNKNVSVKLIIIVQKQSKDNLLTQSIPNIMFLII